MPRHFRFVMLAALLSALGLAYAAKQWTMQPQESTLTFTGTQAGARFQGSFDKFAADVRFDPADLAGSHFDVRIDMASVNTQDAERDETLRGPDLFNVAQWASGHYVTETFTDKGNGKFAATGRLTLRDITRAVPIEFSFDDAAGSARLKGTATIKRLDFDIGQGDWQDTGTVANEVEIHFALLLK